MCVPWSDLAMAVYKGTFISFFSNGNTTKHPSQFIKSFPQRWFFTHFTLGIFSEELLYCWIVPFKTVFIWSVGQFHRLSTMSSGIPQWIQVPRRLKRLQHNWKIPSSAKCYLFSCTEITYVNKYIYVNCVQLIIQAFTLAHVSLTLLIYIEFIQAICCNCFG